MASHGDPQADEIVRLASDLVAGRVDAGWVPNVELSMHYGFVSWRAVVPVKAPRKPNRFLSVSARYPQHAVSALLNLVREIPVKSWD